MKLHEVIKRLESLMFDFDNATNYVSVEDVEPFKKQIKAYFEGKEQGECIWIATDSYGCAGFLAMSSAYSEAVEQYIDSLNPESEAEKEEWIDCTQSIMFNKLFGTS